MNQKQQGGYANTDEQDPRRQHDQAGEPRPRREATDEGGLPPRPDDAAGRPGSGSETHPERDAMERPL